MLLTRDTWLEPDDKGRNIAPLFSWQCVAALAFRPIFLLQLHPSTNTGDTLFGALFTDSCEGLLKIVDDLEPERRAGAVLHLAQGGTVARIREIWHCAVADETRPTYAYMNDRDELVPFWGQCDDACRKERLAVFV